MIQSKRLALVGRVSTNAEWAAIAARQSERRFLFIVTGTGIICTPGCPAARLASPVATASEASVRWPKGWPPARGPACAVIRTGSSGRAGQSGPIRRRVGPPFIGRGPGPGHAPAHKPATGFQRQPQDVRGGSHRPRPAGGLWFTSERSDLSTRRAERRLVLWRLPLAERAGRGTVL
jgi:hypothetical protein